MSTYKRLKKLSNERLANTSVYWPIDYVKDATVESLGEQSQYLTGGYVPQPQGERMSYADSHRLLLKDAGVVAVRNAVVGFGYFDGRYKMRALPMYADLDSRGNSDDGGSYHIAIWTDYYNRRLGKKGKGGLRTAGGADVLKGDAILMENDDRPIVYMSLPNYSTGLSPAHMNALTEMSAKFSMAKYVLSVRSFEFIEFNDGNLTKVEY